MKNDNLSFQGLEDIARAIRATIPPDWSIEKYQTLIAGFFVIIAACIAWYSLREQTRAQEKAEKKKQIEEQLHLLRAFLADVKAIIVACNEYNGKIDAAAKEYGRVIQSHQKLGRDTSSVQQGILVPFSSQFYNEMNKLNGILQPEIAEKISIFYNAAPIYELKMKQMIPLSAFEDPNLPRELINLANEFKWRAESLKNDLENEIQVVEATLK